MPKLLPPTVGERLARCGTQVEVWGAMPGATVTLDVDGVPHSVQANASSHIFTVPPLPGGARVHARQKLGPDRSEPGNEVTAEDVPLPPAPPKIEPSVPRCVQCLFAWGVAPGSTVEVHQGVNLVAAHGTANRDGFACMPVTEPPMESYRAQVTTCGHTSPPVQVTVAPALSEVPAPRIVEPLFECQSVVAFEGLFPGASYEIFLRDRQGTESSLGSFCACTPTMTVNVPHSFRAGDVVQAAGSMVNDRWDCQVHGRMSGEVAAVHPDDRIKPVISEPVWEGDRTIDVTNQVEGGTITLMRKVNAGTTQEEDLGRRPSSSQPQVSVGLDLDTDNVIWVVQELCGVTVASDPVTVRGRPPDIPAVRVRRPVFDCAEVVLVDQVIPGAKVWVRQVPLGQPGPEFLLGSKKVWATTGVVEVSPQPRDGFQIVAYQEIGGRFSPASPPEPVEFREDMPSPVVVPPVRPGDTHVWCENLLVGARVRLFNKIVGFQTVTVQIGAGTATGSASSIPVWGAVPQGGRILATQMLCREGRPSQEVPARTGQPCTGAPPYDPGTWNSDPEHRRCNNCYNYATDKRDSTGALLDNFAQPGGGLLSPAQLNCEDITQEALTDGLRECVNGGCHPCHHKVALVMNPGVDYHWYRQDAGGMWSHKRGGTAAKNVDESGNPISNPETADRAGYTQFCGYFCVYTPDVHLSGICPD